MIGSAVFYFYYPNGTYDICYAPRDNFPIVTAINFLLMEKQQGKNLAIKLSKVNKSLEFIDDIYCKADYKYVIDSSLALSITCYADNGKVIVSEYRNYHDFINWLVCAAKTINDNHSTIMEV